MSIIPNKIEKIFENLFGSAKSLIDAVGYLHKDLEDFKKSIKDFRKAIDNLREDIQCLRIDIDKLDKSVRDNTMVNIKK